MIYEIFTVHDRAAGAYLPPLSFGSIGVALRNFTDAANDKDHQFAHHPKDYTMFHIGSFDDSNATFSPLVPPVALACALDVLKVQLPLPIDEVETSPPFQPAKPAKTAKPRKKAKGKN